MIAALGLALVATSLADGELRYGCGVGLSAFLLHLGLLCDVLGVVAVSVGDHRPLLGAVGTHVAFFVLACALMYYDLVLAPPEYGTVPSTADVIANRSQLALVLLPVTVGYLAGALDGAGGGGRESRLS